MNIFHKVLPFFFILFSCSNIEPIKKEDIATAPSEISIEEVESSRMIEYEETKKALKKEVHLSLIGKGPVSFSYIGLLKALRKKDLYRIKEVSGKGLGALVAALYGKYKSINMLEWVLFKYLGKDLIKNNDKESFYNKCFQIIEREFSEPLDFKLKFISKRDISVKEYLKEELTKAQKQDYRGIYWGMTQECKKVIGDFDHFCLSFSNSKESKFENNINKVTFPYFETKGKSLVDIIAEGRKHKLNLK